jgi:hypothetical protein
LAIPKFIEDIVTEEALEGCCQSGPERLKLGLGLIASVNASTKSSEAVFPLAGMVSPFLYFPKVFTTPETVGMFAT